jgi:hypothetical protein
VLTTAPLRAPSAARAVLSLSLSRAQLTGKMPSIVPPPPLRRRNSDNTLIKEKLGWAPSIKLADGLKITHDWIKAELAAEGGDASAYATSTICGTAAPKELGTLRASDAEEKHN